MNRSDQLPQHQSDPGVDLARLFTDELKSVKGILAGLRRDGETRHLAKLLHQVLEVVLEDPGPQPVHPRVGLDPVLGQRLSRPASSHPLGLPDSVLAVVGSKDGCSGIRVASCNTITLSR
jgi:hypothetical protein